MVGKASFRAVPLALCGAALFAQPAHAALGMMAMPMAVTSALAGVNTCPATGASALGLARAQATVPVQSKAAALLGGQVSQLELMRQQQAGLAPAAAAPVVAGATSSPALEPGAGAVSVSAGQPVDCSAGFGLTFRSMLSPTRFAASAPRPATLSPDDFLASKRLAIRSTPFDREWNRVRGAGLSRSAVAAAGTRPRGPLNLSTLAAVNGWANATIRYVEDRELYGKADYWATAGESLRRHAGDCEDIAIVKMQLLAAYGVRREDMHLVIARDLARGADHAMLVVKLDGQTWLLDNATDKVLDAGASYDYRPVLSFNNRKKWIHGY